MSRKEYKLTNGKKAVFEYDTTGVGKVALECMDELMSMIADRPHGEWKPNPKIGWGETWVCSICGEKTTSSFMGKPRYEYCPMCGAKMYGERKESE